MRRIEKRGVVNVLCDDYGCSPATKAEAEFFDEITRLRAEVADLAHALREMTDDRDSWREQESARAAEAVRFMQERDALRAALEDVRLLAARHRTEDWAKHMLRFCESAGVVGSPLRGE